MIDVEIAPEPDEAERAVLAAFVTDDAQVAGDASPSPWARAALEEAVAGDNDAYDSAPPL